MTAAKNQSDKNRFTKDIHVGKYIRCSLLCFCFWIHCTSKVKLLIHYFTRTHVNQLCSIWSGKRQRINGKKQLN